MILGVGIDVTDVREMERRLQRIRGYFTAAELDLIERRGEVWAAAAKRFAAKEATIKALGGNDALGGVAMREIEVVTSKSGRPTLRLTGGAARQLADITPAGFEAVLEVSVTDHPPVAAAMVVIWARSKLYRE